MTEGRGLWLGEMDKGGRAADDDKDSCALPFYRRT
jgi:hypothetical protein